MAKKKKDSELIAAAKSLSDPLHEPEHLRQIRDFESRLSTEATAHRIAESKLKQAEEDLSRERQRLEVILETKDRVNPRKVGVGLRKKGGSATAIICANDWHAEEKVDPELIDNANEFNLDIADQRINRLWQKSLYLLDFARGISNIKDIVLWLGGDLINGGIHEELEETNFLGQTEAILWVQNRVASGIELLLKEANVNSITVACNYGNHGRTTKKKRISTGYCHSWEWGAYHNLANYFRTEPRVTWKIAKGYHCWLDIQGHAVRFHHGDSVKYYGGVGGVTIPLRKAIHDWNRRRVASLDILGHFHQFLDLWNVVISGCLVGYSPYALSIKAEYQEPTQTFIVVDKSHAKVLAIPIYVAG